MNGRGGGVGRIEVHSHRFLMEVHGGMKAADPGTENTH